MKRKDQRKKPVVMISVFCLIIIMAGFFSIFHLLKDNHSNSDHSCKLAFSGDVMLGRGVAQNYSDRQAQGNTMYWASALEGIKPVLTEADIAAINLESPLSEHPVSPEISDTAPTQYNLCAPARASLALQNSGIDLVSLANNHSYDCNEKGLEETAGILKQAGIISLEHNQSYNLTLNGLRLTYLAYDDISSPVKIDVIEQQINDAYKQGNLVIVSIHWGTEYQSQPNQRQKALAQSMADAGAALIWGHHPHVIQPVEWIQGKNKASQTLVAYSLGNLLFDQSYPQTLRQSMILIVNCNSEGIQSYETIPVTIELPRFRTVFSK